ncbi:vacuolar-processing enzyme-like [Bidens hawaiensis]|uniref:vacuolar-processing enzyme-like n=1 Tax=Bidens hawaiensis TaxID=980011 RepID=UPI00404ADD67
MGDGKLYKDHLSAMFQQLHRRGKYKSVVAYISACISGNIFSSFNELYKNMNIYAMTSSNETEISFRNLEDAFLEVSLGNFFDLAWIQDSWMYDRRNRSLEQQYEKVKEIVGRPSFHQRRSTVMQYGKKEITNEPLASYHGFTGLESRKDK